jgi:hypothetical protein
VWRIVALLVGVALLAWRLDADARAAIRDGFAALDVSGFAMVLALSLPRFAARATAWVALLAGGLRFVRALGATIAGDAAGNLTPFGLFVSEPTKVAYAAAEGASGRTFAALAAENFFYSVSVAIYVVIGAAAMLEAFAVPPVVRTMGILALAGMALVLAGAGWTAWQRPSVLSVLLGRLPIARARTLVDRVRDFEVNTYGSVGGHTSRLARVVLAHASFHVLSFLEMWLTLYLLTGTSLPLAALVLDAFGRVANILFKVIPLQLGVHQVGSEAVAVAVGLPAEIGLTSSIVRTARVLVWAVVGVVLLGAMSRSSRKSQG